MVEYCELFVFFQQNFIMVLGSIAGLFPIQIVPTILCPMLMVPSSQLEMVAITGENQRRKCHIIIFFTANVIMELSGAMKVRRPLLWHFMLTIECSII